MIRSYVTLFLSLLLCGLASTSASGQSQSQRDAEPRQFNFATPLRYEIVFAYKYTERVTEVHSMEGQVVDSSQRLVSYFLTQRQVPSKEKKGLLLIESNIDSMELNFTDMGGDKVYFHTQRLQGADWDLVKHREVFAASVLVNRMATFTLSPYGDVLKVAGTSIASAREQAADANVDQFTRERLSEVLSDEYLISVFLPWRLVPIGRQVSFAKEQKVPFWTAFNRISFRDTATTRLVTGPDSALHLTFTARLDRPQTQHMTIAGFDEAVKIGSVSADVTGDLKLDDDGVINSGWTMMQGMVKGTRRGVPTISTIRHEVYIESMGMMPFPSN